ncbi:putative GEM-like protein 8 [Punica granatum]|uniref:GEM-like protein 8 n=2 Tax=Punica granatum TaxID=22663 RepID=A0A6P8C5B7_PUNGR|nr:putative GEM-like protein 8 [Punica granatum]
MEQVIGIPVISGSLLLTDSDSMQCQSTHHEDQLQGLGKDSMLKRMNKLRMKADFFAHSFRAHVRSNLKMSETVKGKLSLGAQFLQVGGREKVFKTLFNVSENERLLKASHCCLSTSAGHIAGFLFISTGNLAFCSHRSIKVCCPNGEAAKVHYKVLIPLSKIETAHQSENVEKPSQKYMQIVTVDNFDFWFMGFLNYQKTWKYIQQALFLEQ